MASRDHILLYLHIPKAAGTTMSSLLFEQYRNAEEEQAGKFCSGVYYHPAGFINELDQVSNEEVSAILRRNDLRAVTGHFQYGLHQSVSRPCQYATILREPVSRICSLYHFQRLNEARYGHLNQVRLAEDAGIEQFVTAPPYPEIDNGMTRRISGIRAPIGGCDRHMLNQAILNLEKFAIVGLSDRFDETLILMSAKLGWGEPPLYYPFNVNTKRQAGDTLDTRTRSLIREQNRYDIELYQAATELFGQQVSRHHQQFPELLDRYRERKQLWYSKLGLLTPEEQTQVASS